MMHQDILVKEKVDKSILFQFKSSKQYEIHSIGLQSCRFQSALFLDGLLYLPTSCSLSVWDIQHQQRVNIIKCNNNAIYSLQYNHKYIYSVGFNGQIAIIDRFTLEVVKRINEYQGFENRFTSINQNYLSLNSELTQDNQKGCVHLYDTEGNLVWSLNGRYRFASLFDQHLVIVHEKKIPIQNKELLSKKELEKLKNTRKYTYEIQIYELFAQQPIKSIPTEWGASGLLVAAKSDPPYNLIAYLLDDRRLAVYDNDKQEFIYQGKFEGVGAILSASFNGAELVLSSTKNMITAIDFSIKDIQLPSVIGNNSIEPKLRFIPLQFGLEAKPQFVKDFGNNQFLIVNEEGVYLIHEGEYKFKKMFGGITFCGIDICHQKKNVYVGDFIGGVHGFDLKQKSLEQVHASNVGLPIRSLAYFKNSPYSIFGTIDGCLYTWNHIEEPQFIAVLEGGITILRTQKDYQNTNHYVLASTTGGYFYIYLVDSYHHFNLLVTYHAHKPLQNFNQELFGSLDIHAEMWSTCFHPNDPNIIATCSEDQNVHIYSNCLSEPIQKSILKGHKLAVTSVDWQQMNVGIILASCSDDQTVRFYDEELNLIQVISTSWIQEWHTLTYIVLEKNGDLAIFGSQNGYLFIYSLKEKQFQYAEKIHLGGIEGLAIKDHVVCTCSSDNIINVLELK